MHSLFILFTLFLFMTSSLATIDYTRKATNSFKNTSNLKSERSFKKKASLNQSGHFLKCLGLATEIEAFDLNTNIQSLSSLNLFHLKIHYQSSSTYFFNLDYTWGKYNFGSENISGMEIGNPEIILGVNWLRVGSYNNFTDLNFIVGVMPRVRSKVGSSRFDQFIGFESSKKINNLKLSLGSKYRISGAAKNENEIQIGNIQTYFAGLKYFATTDIAFSFEGGSVRIKSKKSAHHSFKNDITSSYLNFQLELLFNNHFGVLLGGKVSTYNSYKNMNDLIRARLWNVTGLYGNSFFLTMNYNI